VHVGLGDVLVDQLVVAEITQLTRLHFGDTRGGNGRLDIVEGGVECEAEVVQCLGLRERV
jgi:hypothetical protein